MPVPAQACAHAYARQHCRDGRHQCADLTSRAARASTFCWQRHSSQPARQPRSSEKAKGFRTLAPARCPLAHSNRAMHTDAGQHRVLVDVDLVVLEVLDSEPRAPAPFGPSGRKGRRQDCGGLVRKQVLHKWIARDATQHAISAAHNQRRAHHMTESEGDERARGPRTDRVGRAGRGLSGLHGEGLCVCGSSPLHGSRSRQMLSAFLSAGVPGLRAQISLALAGSGPSAHAHARQHTLFTWGCASTTASTVSRATPHCRTRMVCAWGQADCVRFLQEYAMRRPQSAPSRPKFTAGAQAASSIGHACDLSLNHLSARYHRLETWAA